MSAPPASTPLPSNDTEEAADTAAAPATPARPPPPPFKPSTFILTFMFILGFGMIIDAQLRYQVAATLGLGLGPLIGFGGHYPLLTMFLAAVIEMLAAALAYNWTTDWVKTAKTQKWSSAFRKFQMAAMRSGKKDRVEALKPHQLTVTKLAGELQIAQLKGLAVTWFLLIAIYSWVYLYLGGPAGGITTHPIAVSTWVSLGGLRVNLLGNVIGPIQNWFVLFSVYSFPFSLIFRRMLKHYTLRRHPSFRGPTVAGTGATGGAA
ncbi:MAG: EMC3/TMCO1 family protein [Thermoplasmata archaeon]|nr:EMC3/TMCO1 family protein [Thermoplasmata archaeon]